MVEPRYNIILTGATIGGTDQAAACRNLARIFRIDIDQAHAVFRRAPLVVKKNLDQASLARFAAAFAKAHIQVRIEPNPLTLKEPVSGLGTKSDSTPPADQPALAPNKRGLSFSTAGSDAFALLSVTLPEGETLWVDSTSVVSSDAGIALNSHDTSVRRFNGADGMYISECICADGSGEICLAPNLPGQIKHFFLQGQNLQIAGRAFLASAAGVALEERRHARHLAPTLDRYIYCAGGGDLWLQVCGSALMLHIHGQYNCKASHLVAWSEGLTLQAGEGPLPGTFITVSGTGTLWLQSQSAEGLLSWAQQLC